MASFEDLDQQPVYDRFKAAFSEADTLNLVVNFDSEAAFAALNIELSGIEGVLEAELVKSKKTRWINIWGPERQKDIVKAIAGHYGFSARLLGLMCTDHDKPMVANPDVSEAHGSFHAMMHSPRFAGFKSVESHTSDIEAHEMVNASRSKASGLDLNHYRVVNEVWHYCSVDWGSRYLCIGYNSLCNPQPEHIDLTDPEKHLDDKPLGRRLWSWLVLCDDGTIISIHENPFPNHRGYLESKDHAILKLIRRNLLSIFQQLSTASDPSRSNNPIMTVPLRSGLQVVKGSEIVPSDGPSLMFYYLFDDWLTSYSLVARQEHQYGAQLGRLRVKMSIKPAVPLIENLHHIGRQLAILKRIYESYALIIDRILGRQQPMTNPKSPRSNNSSAHIAQLLDDTSSDKEGLSREAQSFGVSLSPAAIVRFERLRDRVKLYALSEIQDCLDEKESLVFLNFNLITLKESQAVERLTRITILLAKLTILFMPVSLMTAYFSIQIKELEGVYTVKTYWTAFGVIMGLSIMFLVVFGTLSGTLEGKPIYQSLTRILFESSKKALKARRRRSLQNT